MKRLDGIWDVVLLKKHQISCHRTVLEFLISVLFDDMGILWEHFFLYEEIGEDERRNRVVLNE